MSQRLIVIAGPTAVGKTELSLRLAAAMPVELISADSVQVYRGFDIGSAKASPEERAQVVHHLIDVRSPEDTYSAGQFADEAARLVEEIGSRGRMPVLVGGTGLYLRALLYGLSESPRGDAALRKKLEERWNAEGATAMMHELRAVDPLSAERLHPNDKVRVLRALEVYEVSGQPLSAQHQAHASETPRFDFAGVGLTSPRKQLYDRIDERVVRMVDLGLVDEVRGLLESGVSPRCQPMGAIGYRETVDLLEGRLLSDEYVAEVQKNTRRFAKRQLTWFRKADGFRWFDALKVNENPDELIAALTEFSRSGTFTLGEVDERAISA